MRSKSEAVIAAYRPKPGKESQLRRLVREHRRALAEAGLVTPRASLILRARSDGTLLEIFEWVSPRAADEAHQYAPVRAMWNKLRAVADFVALSDVAEATKAFSHFEALPPRRTVVRVRETKEPVAARPKP